MRSVPDDRSQRGASARRLAKETVGLVEEIPEPGDVPGGAVA
jgi:hypothetical protein